MDPEAKDIREQLSAELESRGFQAFDAEIEKARLRARGERKKSPPMMFFDHIRRVVTAVVGKST